VIAGAAIAVLAACALYAALVAAAYRARCRKLEDQIRRMGGTPEEV
jgi:hypothetical protein